MFSLAFSIADFKSAIFQMPCGRPRIAGKLGHPRTEFDSTLPSISKNALLPVHILLKSPFCYYRQIGPIHENHTLYIFVGWAGTLCAVSSNTCKCRSQCRKNFQCLSLTAPRSAVTAPATPFLILLVSSQKVFVICLHLHHRDDQFRSMHRHSQSDFSSRSPPYDESHLVGCMDSGCPLQHTSGENLSKG